MMMSSRTFKALGPYSQHFIFFPTFKWAQKARVLHNTKLQFLSRDKHSSLLGPFVSDEENEFGTWRAGANFIKLFLSVIYGFSLYAKVFVPGKLFQPSLMFVGEARSLPQNGAPERCFTRVGFWPYPETLDQAGKASQGQTLQLIVKICKLRTKKVL